MAALSLHSFSLLVLVLVSQDAILAQRVPLYQDYVAHLCGADLVEMLYETCDGKLNIKKEKDRRRLRGRPQGEGIVEKCCFRSCSLDVLRQYCAVEPGSTEEPRTTEEPVPTYDPDDIFRYD